MGISLQERLHHEISIGIVDDGNDDDDTTQNHLSSSTSTKSLQTMLNVQYRMKPEISDFPSKQFYNGKLTNGDNVQRADYGLFASCGGDGTRTRTTTTTNNKKNKLLELTPPWCFFQVNGTERRSPFGSYFNIDECFATIAILRTIRKRNQDVRTTNSSSSCRWWTSDKVRVITFYSAQVETLKRMLRKENDGRGMSNVVVSTVDSSQGCEADIIILSFVRTSKNGGFLNDDRRMNVALTRAKYKLICLGNIHNISSWQQPRRRGQIDTTLLSSSSSLGMQNRNNYISARMKNVSATTTHSDDKTTLQKMVYTAKQRDCISFVFDKNKKLDL